MGRGGDSTAVVREPPPEKSNGDSSVEALPRSTKEEEAAMEKDTKPAQKSPEQEANFLSQLFFWWLGPLVVKGYRNPLEQSDLPPLPDSDDVQRIFNKFSAVWEKEQKTPSPSVTRALFVTFRWRLFVGAILQLITILLQLTPSLFLNSLLVYMEGRDTSNFMYKIFGEHFGFYAAGALFVVPTVTTMVNNQFYQQMFRLGVHVKTSLVEVVYQKSLRLSNGARQAKSVGEIVTLMQVDTEKVSQTTPFLHVTWSALLQVFFNLALLIYFIGWSALTGFALLLFTVPTQAWLVSLLLKMQRLILLNTGKRVKVINEVLQGMRVVKSYAWEKPFKASVTDIRANELAAMARRVYIRAVQSCLMLATPTLIMVVTFAFYSQVAKRSMGAAVVFTAVSLFNSLRLPLMMYPFVVNAVLAGHVSLSRIGAFLGSEELSAAQRDPEGADGLGPAPALEVAAASFRWSAPPPAPEGGKGTKAPPRGPNGNGKKVEAKEKKSSMWRKKGNKEGGKVLADEKENSNEEVKELFGLSSISLRVKRGELVAVVGPVGSGKSSLVAALLGEMEQVAGERVIIRGSVAYCSQQPWIMNSSLKENVLFGNEYDEERYKAAIHACALQQDLAALPDGDATEIGERGINLSGGQKQRVALARAAFCGAEVVVLDDPLSAVDAHVGAHIFEHCVQGLLKGKTRVVVTNQLHYVPSADLIVVLKAGRIAECGTYKEVMALEGEFAQLMRDSGSHTDNAASADSNEFAEMTDSSTLAKAPKLTSTISKVASAKGQAVLQKAKEKGSKYSREGTLVEQEGRARGMLKLDVYWKYWTESSRVVPLGVLVLYGVVQAVDAYQRYWLAYWTADKYGLDGGAYLAVYGALAGAFTALVYVRTLGQALLGLWVAARLHAGMLEAVLRCPMAFFDTTPVGRILNRFSADQSAVDETLPFSWTAFLNILFQVFSTIIVITIITPIWAAIFLPVAVLYFFLQQVYRKTARELKRLDAVSKSPVYQQFTETLNGLSTIRAFNQQERFLRMCDDKLDANNRAYFLLRCCDRWLSVYLEIMGNIMVAAAAFLAVSKRGSLYAGFAGISIDYALQITASLSMLVRNMTDTENQMNAVERMLEYRDKQEQEAPEVDEEHRPPKDWPQSGNIEIQSLTMRYRPSLPLVLKEVSLKVEPGEKVGVVGRTGSGKSSLMLCLFRLVEPASGRILIDGVDICSIGLHDLRSRLSIIPQDPVLFSGTVRFNLDPFQERSDEEVWEALERAHLKEKVAGLTGKLDAEVVEYGENFSLGERQLLCLGRVLLRQSRILIMDEATSSVDYETDLLIQATIRSHLKACTMLIIAHRINTVIDASRILLLDAGEVAEYDTPSKLLETSGSKFAALVEDTGEQSAEHLRKVARGEVDFFSSLKKPEDVDGAAAEADRTQSDKDQSRQGRHDASKP